MSDADQPFRRPTDGFNADANPREPVPNPSPSEAAPSHPVLLDPELHQSVWKPWQNSASISAAAGKMSHRGVDPHERNVNRVVLVGALVVIVALLVALIIPGLLAPPEPSPEPLLPDIREKPAITWTSEAADYWCATDDPDHVVLTTERRIWSINLESGATRWSATPANYVDLTCLPGTNAVAVRGTSTFDITLLDATTGAAAGIYRSGSAVEVVALGENIGFVDTSNVLTAYSPMDLDKPLWTRPLEGDASFDTYSLNFDTETVMLVRHPDFDVARQQDEGFVIPIKTADGSRPAWALGGTIDNVYYVRLGDVVARHDERDDFSTTTLLDLRGRELWDVNDQGLFTAGARVFLALPLGDAEDSLRKSLREVDPETGEPLSEKRYEGDVDFLVSVPLDHLGVVTGGSLHVLDKDLQQQSALTLPGVARTYEGETLLYVVSSIQGKYGSEDSTFTALDPAGNKVLWSLDLAPGQHVVQLGPHMILVNADATLQGLQGPR